MCLPTSRQACSPSLEATYVYIRRSPLPTANQPPQSSPKGTRDRKIMKWRHGWVVVLRPGPQAQSPIPALHVRATEFLGSAPASKQYAARARLPRIRNGKRLLIGRPLLASDHKITKSEPPILTPKGMSPVHPSSNCSQILMVVWHRKKRKKAVCHLRGSPFCPRL